MNNGSLEICIIDSGVNEPALHIGRISTNIEITRRLQKRKRSRYDAQVINHATVCAAIIRKYAPDAVLHSIKILNSREKSTMEQLKTAVMWCLDNNIGIIHMSIGSTIYSDFDEMRHLVNMACMHGVIIVAACSNNGKITYPAAFDSVIGVKCDRQKRLEEGEYIYNGVSFDGVEITACSKHSLTLPNGKSFASACTNSYAAPFITASVYNIMRGNPKPSIGEIKEALQRGAKEGQSISNFCTFSRNVSWVENALIVDYGNNSEFMNSIKKPFSITGLIVPKLPDGRNVLGDIKESADMADTVILLPPGCEDSSYKAGIISLCEEIGSLNKNIIYLGNDDIDTLAHIAREKHNIRVWNTAIYQCFDYKCYSKKEIEIPIIILYGSFQHLMIELLNGLVNAFSQDGYHAVGISDSALGILAGLEYLCPGYALQAYTDKLQAFYNFYDPGVMLLGFNEKSSFEAAVNEVNPDIKLIVSDEAEDINNGVLSAPKDESSRLIHIILEECASASAHKDNAIVLSYTKDDDIGEIYKYILSILGIYS